MSKLESTTVTCSLVEFVVLSMVAESLRLLPDLLVRHPSRRTPTRGLVVPWSLSPCGREREVESRDKWCKRGTTLCTGPYQGSMSVEVGDLLIRFAGNQKTGL